MRERRGDGRKLQHFAASIETCAGPFSCFGWDISNRGARLRVSEKVKLPEHFVIRIEGAIREAKIVWRESNQVGIRFSSSVAA